MEQYILITENIVSDNAEKWKEKIESVFDDGKGITIDCKGAEFFSSAGLRILLGLQKRMKDGKKISLISVSKNLMEILETTGLASLMDVKLMTKQISLGNLKPFAIGGTGECYKLDDDRILKLYYEDTSDELIEKEKLSAKMALISGIPTAISYEIVGVGFRKGIIYEMLQAKTLAEQIIEHPEDIEEFGKKYATIAKQIHKTKGDSNVFPKWLTSFRKVISEGNLPSDIKKNIDVFLDEMDFYDTYVHGDFNPNNIMISGDELMLIDMADFSIGCPVYDVGSVYLTLIYMNEGEPDDYVYEFTGMTCGLQRKLWNAFASEYFEVNSFEEALEKSEVARTIERFSILKCFFLSLRWPNAFSKELKERFKKDVYKYFK